MNETLNVEQVEEFPIPEMELWGAGVDIQTPAGVMQNPPGHSRAVVVWPSDKDCWEARARLAQYITKVVGNPYIVTLDACFKTARKYGYTAVVLRRGDGSIIDWWEVKL